MALLERVSALLRANLNDLIDRAEDPVKMMNQVIIDMENQLLQVKTQVAIAVADRFALGRKCAESVEDETGWMRKAELAVQNGDEPLARDALGRLVSARKLVKQLTAQMDDQKVQVENLKTAFANLQAKLAETRPQLELLKIRMRRERSATAVAVSSESAEIRYSALEKEAEIERILQDLRSRKRGSES